MNQYADLRLRTRRLNGHLVITMAGEIDIRTAPTVNAYLLATVPIAPSNGTSALVMDLSAVTFMDACGLSTLLRADRHALHAGRRLRLAGPPRPVARLLAITHLDRYFDLYPTSRAAIAQPTPAPTRPPPGPSPPGEQGRPQPAYRSSVPPLGGDRGE